MNRDEKIFRNFLETHGLRAGKKVRAILGAVREMTTHFRAEDILDSLDGHPARIGIATVWRTLRLMQKAGLVEEHYFGKAGLHYEKKRAPASHGHIVCENCGRTAEFDLAKFLPLLNETVKSQGFSFDGYELSLFGSCHKCSQKESEKNDAP